MTNGEMSFDWSVSRASFQRYFEILNFIFLISSRNCFKIETDLFFINLIAPVADVKSNLKRAQQKFFSRQIHKV